MKPGLYKRTYTSICRPSTHQNASRARAFDNTAVNPRMVNRWVEGQGYGTDTTLRSPAESLTLTVRTIDPDRVQQQIDQEIPGLFPRISCVHESVIDRRWSNVNDEGLRSLIGNKRPATFKQMATAPPASPRIDSIELQERSPPRTPAAETPTTAAAAADAETVSSGLSEQAGPDAAALPNGEVVGRHQGRDANHEAQSAALPDHDQRSVGSHEDLREPPPPYHPPPPPYSVAGIAHTLNPAGYVPKKKFGKFLCFSCIGIAVVTGLVVGASQGARSSNHN